MSEEKENEQFTSDTQPASKYDFSNVNLATGEGAQLEFDSWEEFEEYADAYADECEKQGIPL
jgi:hypothetical protein